ncbi:histidinol dehydrogenase [Thermoflavimicrobium daqui]|uniref:Histidinol dehydrogenase n=1 Tax=Thermoflavimicrobium daqui TaxID=2137476 RepID=A0A364K565_9BACL|nr:histidinol dehydrogenase [Thermoflavimicrobium daqui]RAL24502.1 histidinol dehydrogenase [Thermoflavimicrobium daqui]
MIAIVKPDELVKHKQFKSIQQKEEHVVKEIIELVKAEGDPILYELTHRFDGVLLDSFMVRKEEIEQAFAEVDPDFLQAVSEAAERIRRYHEKQKQYSWMDPEEDGTILGQIVRPLERVGVYVPGGRAAYPSTVLMNVLPAKVAGVSEVIMVTPPLSDGNIHASILVAAKIAGVDTIYKIGGAQAIAALAYGTDTIPQVDKIVGPGNIYVALAKKAVYGQVDIDSIAGPSDIVVIADKAANPTYVAADMLAQAEHDPLSSAILLTPSVHLAEQVIIEIEQQLGDMNRHEIAASALKNRGGICITNDLPEAFALMNQLAPEHLEILIEKPWDFLSQVKNAGAIFLGEYSPEAIGDYFAGPNHVLPTEGTSRFFSGLGVDSFIKKMSLISYSRKALLRDGARVMTLAHTEGLGAHAYSIQVRLDKEKAGENK